jgi:DNA repair exonuclease SbcCD ATPase subunit
METKLRELEAQNAELTNQKNTLQQELSSRGDVQAEHARSIEELSNKNKAELTKSQQDNAAQIDQLQKEIADRESKLQANAQQMEQIQKQIAEKDNQIQSISQKIQELEQKISEKDSQLAEKDRQIAELQQNTSTTQQQQQQNTEAITQATNRIQQLEKEKADLENINKDLVQRIIAATDAINIATAQLEELVNQGFYDKSKQDVDVIIKEIEASLQLISNSIQGSNITTNVSNSINSSYDKNIINLNGVLTNVNSLMRDLQAKSNQFIRNNNGKNVYDKYKAAYETIREFKNQNPNANDDVMKSKTKEILSKYNINISNTGIIQGGNMNLKKSKKKIRIHSTTRKQKGGYLWGKQKTFSFKNKTISKISKSVPTPKSHKKRL